MNTKDLINSKYAMINDLLCYLQSTDYHNQKHQDDISLGIENPYTTPEDVLTKRKISRENINSLQEEIKALELILEQENNNKDINE